MDKTEWSEDDDIDDVLDELVVPMPQPTVLGANNNHSRDSDSGNRAAYNERMARARSGIQSQRRQGSGGMFTSNNDRPSRPTTAQGAPPIDVLTQEVEEMELAEQQMDAHAARLAERTQAQQAQAENQVPAATYNQQSQGASYAAPVAQSDSPPRARENNYRGNGESVRSAPIEIGDDDIDDAPPPARSGGGGSEQQMMVSVPRPVEATPAVIDTSDLRTFLMRTGPQGAMVQCYIQRRKSGLARLYPTYEVYLKDGEQFLLAARRRKKQKMSNYKVSLDRDDLSRHTSNYFGKLKSNFMGTEFQMYDNGVNPEKLSEAQRDGSHTQVRQELATVLYKQNVLGSRGPRKMKVIVPNVDEHGQRVSLRPTRIEDTMLEQYKSEQQTDQFVVLKNKQPKWNDQVGAYVLNFNGRVTRASVKNFQLCNVAKDPDLVVMQFGRVARTPSRWTTSTLCAACRRLALR